MPTYYEIMGLDKTATQADIKKAYKKLSLKFHPDKNVGNEADAQAMFVQIAEAYTVLGDPAKRSEYDESIYGGRGSSSRPAPRGPDGFSRPVFSARDAFRMFDSIFEDLERQHEEMLRSHLNARSDGDHRQSQRRVRGGVGGTAGNGPFGLLFGENFFGGRQQVQPRRGDGFPFGTMFGDDFFGSSSSSSSSSFSSSSFSSSSGGISSGRSVSTTTFIDNNGKRTTKRTTTVINPDGTRQVNSDKWQDEVPRDGGGRKCIKDSGRDMLSRW